MPSELRSLDQILSLADNGGYLPEMQRRLADLLTETHEFAETYRTKAGAKIKIEVSVTLNAFGEAEISVKDELSAPKPPKAKATAWLTEDGALTPHNPAQSRMEVRDVGGKPEFRSAQPS